VAKSTKNDRRAVIDDIRRKQKGAERTRGLIIVAVCAVIAVAIVAVAAFGPIKDQIQTQSSASKALQDVGQSPTAAGCRTPYTIPADGNQQHVPEGQHVQYTTAPPAFGPHWNVAGIAPVTMSRKFYDTSDTPQLEQLVHNLEHGYTLLWYDQTIANDSSKLNQIRAIADKFAGTDDWRDKFIAVPWTAAEAADVLNAKSDLTKFPDGMHIAFTHWSAGGIGQTDTTKQVGAFEYCAGVSGAALKDFMTQFPYTDSPEPVAM
jgi:hypothetical protein